MRGGGAHRQPHILFFFPVCPPCTFTHQQWGGWRTHSCFLTPHQLFAVQAVKNLLENNINGEKRFAMLAPAVSANAAKYVAMTKIAASRGSRDFVCVPSYDERMPWPNYKFRGTDEPLKHFRGWTRWRWMIHDFRVYGFKEFVRKHYYLGECWRQKGEKIFAGQDELGNKYWYTWDGARGNNNNGRFVEPLDPHHFRGQDAQTCPPAWQMWLQGMMAHTPAIIKARGEWGLHGRTNGAHVTFTYRWHKDLWNFGMGNDPTYVPTTGMVLSPWYKLLKEAGFSRFVPNIGLPTHMPMVQPHDVKQEVVESFYRGQNAFCRWSKGHDHDEWRN